MAKEVYGPFLPNDNDETIKRLLKKMGLSSEDDLFDCIPEKVRLRKSLNIPEATDEHTLRREIEQRLEKVSVHPNSLCFLGGGVWPHYVPAVVDSIVSRQEFYTSYTPYQPEISQGMLQALFEYQSLMCDLLKMEVCNSSMYDWSTAAAEAVRMACRVTEKRKVVIAGNVSLNRINVIKTYCWPLDIEVTIAPFDREYGGIDIAKLNSIIDDNVSAFYFENPNYFGIIETGAGEVVELLHQKKSLAITGIEPISLSIIKPPGEYNADIVVGEGQPLGIHMNYGGPHLGIFAVNDIKLARSMPGRLIGMTKTMKGENKAFTMVLQSREQHIRRESATSNICTNQALMALASSVYLALLGKSGLRMLAETIISNSHYAASRISKINGLKFPVLKGPFFSDFVVGYEKDSSEEVYSKLADLGILAGYPLEKDYGFGSAGLYSVTEVHTYDDIEKLVKALELIVR